VPEKKNFITIPAKETNCLYFAHGTPPNQTSWLETIADVEVIPPSEDGLFSIENLELL
jgi:hypothetical protein